MAIIVLNIANSYGIKLYRVSTKDRVFKKNCKHYFVFGQNLKNRAWFYSGDPEVNV